MKKSQLPQSKDVSAEQKKRVNFHDLSPEDQQAVLQAMQRLRINIGREILRANPGLDKIH